MEHRRRTLTMDWDGLGDDVDDDDAFFEPCNRLSTAAPDSSSSDDDDNEEFDDPRLSFASAVSSVHPRHSTASRPSTSAADAAQDYGVWMAAPISITERRQRLLHGMGLEDDKDFSKKSASADLDRAVSKKKMPFLSCSSSSKSEPATNSASVTAPSPSSDSSAKKTEQEKQKQKQSSVQPVQARARSEGDIDFFSMEKSRKEKFMGDGSKQSLKRTTTAVAFTRVLNGAERRAAVRTEGTAAHSKRSSSKKMENSDDASFFLIKNLDTGKEFIVNEYDENGTWNKLSDLETGKQLSKEEFEKTVGKSRVVSELMKRAQAGRNDGLSRKLSSSSYISRSLRMSKKRGVALLKNIKDVAKDIIKELEPVQPAQPALPTAESKSQWVRVRQTGKSHKELSALHLCQEFQAHEGCVWTIKFSLDGRYLASAGEDRVIHVWEVQECEVMSLKPDEGSVTPIHTSLLASSNEASSSLSTEKEKKKKGKYGSKRGTTTIPEYVHVPEIVFSLSDKPYFSFQGHLDEVLDLSWSKSQLLLSSSMDKTVRLWNLETKTCLNTFTHNDYVTSIQFNPFNDDHFISGSLDAKVRIWNIPERHVVDWTEIHEMVTAVSYTPDGQGAFVGTHKGSCRTYSTEDSKLTQTGTIELRRKKKSHLRKVTGFQFAPGISSEVLVTSADSRIRILDGSEVVQKYRGFRNANSQIAASFSPDGRYIISASEDSEVYIWKHEEHNKSGGNAKGKNVLVTRSHEHFHCKDVSVAITWPCTIRGDPPSVPMHQSKRQSKREEIAASPKTNSKRMLPPLPKKSSNNNYAPEGATNSPREDPSAMLNTESGLGDSFASSRRMTQPRSPMKGEEDPEAISRTDSGCGDSFSFGSSSVRHGDSNSSCPSSSWSSTILPSAWGLVIVTAGFGGEIKCYQNFGLPKRMSRRQANLFGGHNTFSPGNT